MHFSFLSLSPVMRWKGRRCAGYLEPEVNYGHHCHFHLTYGHSKSQGQTQSQGRNTFLLVSGRSCRRAGRGAQGRGGEAGSGPPYCSAAWGVAPGAGVPWEPGPWWHSWPRDGGGRPAAGARLQPLSVCGAWVVRARRDLGRPHFFSLPSEGRQGLPVSPVEVRGQRWQDYSSAPRTERWSDS